MKRVIEQLTAYHTAQGLQGDDLSQAVAADVERVRDNHQTRNYLSDDSQISELFDWSTSPEGLEYWSARDAA